MRTRRELATAPAWWALSRRIEMAKSENRKPCAVCQAAKPKPAGSLGTTPGYLEAKKKHANISQITRPQATQERGAAGCQSASLAPLSRVFITLSSASSFAARGSGSGTLLLHLLAHLLFLCLFFCRPWLALALRCCTCSHIYLVSCVYFRALPTGGSGSPA